MGSPRRRNSTRARDARSLRPSRSGISATLAITRDRLELLHSVAEIIATVLQAQAADLDRPASIVLRRLIMEPLGQEIERVHLLIDGREGAGRVAVTSPKPRTVALAFGAALRECRREAGFSQERLALMAGLDRTYPSLLERGLRTPDANRHFQLSETLDISASTLMQRTLSRFGPGCRTRLKKISAVRSRVAPPRPLSLIPRNFNVSR